MGKKETGYFSWSRKNQERSAKWNGIYANFERVENVLSFIILMGLLVFVIGFSFIFVNRQEYLYMVVLWISFLLLCWFFWKSIKWAKIEYPFFTDKIKLDRIEK